MKPFNIQLKTTFLLLLAATVGPLPAQAETAYVSDRLVINLRSEQTDGSIVATLRSDDQIEIIEKSGKNIRVTTRDGKTGWTRNQYITTIQPKHFIILGLKKEITRLNESINDLQKEKGPLGEQLENLKAKYGAAIKEYEERLSRELTEQSALAEKLEHSQITYKELQEKSAQAVAAVDRHEQLLAEKKQLLNETAQLKAENIKLRTTTLFWFLAGGGVFLTGWLIGKISRRKTQSSLTL